MLFRVCVSPLKEGINGHQGEEIFFFIHVHSIQIFSQKMEFGDTVSSRIGFFSLLPPSSGFIFSRSSDLLGFRLWQKTQGSFVTQAFQSFSFVHN